MNTTFIPINTTQMQNALTDMGTWLGAYFPAFLGLALFIGALVIVPIVLRGILNWIINGVKNLVYQRNPYSFDKEGNIASHMQYSEESGKYERIMD